MYKDINLDIVYNRKKKKKKLIKSHRELAKMSLHKHNRYFFIHLLSKFLIYAM